MNLEQGAAAVYEATKLSVLINWAEYKRIDPVAVTLAGAVMLLDSAPTRDESRNNMRQAMAKVLEAAPFGIVCFAIESWGHKLTPHEQADPSKWPTPSECADRYTVLTVMLYEGGTKSMTAMATVRPDDTVEPWTESDHRHEMAIMPGSIFPQVESV